jgi:hypothetical protein
MRINILRDSKDLVRYDDQFLERLKKEMKKTSQINERCFESRDQHNLYLFNTIKILTYYLF